MAKKLPIWREGGVACEGSFLFGCFNIDHSQTGAFFTRGSLDKPVIFTKIRGKVVVRQEVGPKYAVQPVKPVLRQEGPAGGCIPFLGLMALGGGESKWKCVLG